MPGVSPRSRGPFFKEFASGCPKNAGDACCSALRRRRILGGVAARPVRPELKDCILVAVTERRTRAEIDAYAAALAAAVA